MPEVEYTTKMALSRGLVWDFVKDMNNWAPMLTGYQKHEIIDDKDSIWTLKGDVGILSRMVRLKFHITEWIDCDRVAFTLEGLNEKVEGGGLLVMEDPAGMNGEPMPNALILATENGSYVVQGDSVWDAAPSPTNWRWLAYSRAHVLSTGPNGSVPAEA